jgi:hypothetical protein
MIWKELTRTGFRRLKVDCAPWSSQYAAPFATKAATKTPLAQKKGKAETSIGGDSRYQLLQNYLFSGHAQSSPPTESDVDMHETVERAWKLHCEQRDQAHQKQLKIKYQRMREAMLELEKLDPELFAIALSKEGEEMYFPRLFKAPTDTLPKTGWHQVLPKLS